MKSKFLPFFLLTMSICIAGCKKANELKPSADINALQSSSRSAALMPVAINTVTTIAGSTFTSGPSLVDGNGTNARFRYPTGIQLADDGSIYIADSNPGVIRKLTSTGMVSTINLPNAPDGQQMLNAEYVGVAKDGTINVITRSNVNSEFPQAWIFSRNKPAYVYSSFYSTYRTLAKDPYEDSFWFTEGLAIGKYKEGPRGDIGTDKVRFDIDSISSMFNQRVHFKALFVGYNKVKYMSENLYLYKYTPGGKSERIFENLGENEFNNITCIVVNRDSRTMYVADAGAIKRIDNGKLTTIAGPNALRDNRDGVGNKADVHAFYLALSKDEGTLYFSDPTARTIRKIKLR